MRKGYTESTTCKETIANFLGAGVIDVWIHENGLVALTGSLSLLEVKGWKGARPMTLATPGEFSRLAVEFDSLFSSNRPGRSSHFLGYNSTGFKHFKTQ